MDQLHYFRDFADAATLAEPFTCGHCAATAPDSATGRARFQSAADGTVSFEGCAACCEAEQARRQAGAESVTTGETATDTATPAEAV